MMKLLAQPAELFHDFEGAIVDCRFSLVDPDEGRRLYQSGHIPGAYYLDLNRDLSGPVGPKGGRHPLPAPQEFAATLAQFGIGHDTTVVAYDDSRFAFASRLWWMMRSLGYRPPLLLNGGFTGYIQAGGQPEPGSASLQPRTSSSETMPSSLSYTGRCNIEGVKEAQGRGAILVDSREPQRYRGEEEPIDPVAGHIPGAINRPWQELTDAHGRVRGVDDLQVHWGDLLEAGELVVYCGSGVTACVNLFSLALLGREDATLYAGSWSDWCTYLQA